MGCGVLVTVSLFFVLNLTLSSYALGLTTDVSTALRKAEELKLYSERYWHIILHYQPSGKGFESLIDDPGFFLSPEGKTNPRSELIATIKSLFEDPERGDLHPKCRFMARFEWLKERLNLDESLFTDINCSEFEEIYKRVQPERAVLIFPAFYMNNPSSMFGHTLLRIDGNYESKLLSHAVNYAAHVESAGILYPIRGIFGFYKGYYKVFPYYEMVSEYNDTEQRDMWEYSLDLTRDEVRRMFLHLWELRNIYSYYYFFDENCSYNLLFLIESARPTLHLTDRTSPWVIPVDTLRIVKESGIIKMVNFRPSIATKIRFFASGLDSDEQEMALEIIDKKLSPNKLPLEDEEKKARILDLAIENIQYRYNKRLIDRREYLNLFLPTLRERSKLKKESKYDIDKLQVKPEDGHFSNRFKSGLILSKEGAFFELNYRPAYHDLSDPDDGYLTGSQIIFLETTLRGYEDGSVVFSGLNIIDIISISPRDRFFAPLSWRVTTGFVRKALRDRREHTFYRLLSGAGLAYRNHAAGIFYLIGVAGVNVGEPFRDFYTLDAGIDLGIIKQFTYFWKLNLYGEALFYGIREHFQEYNLQVSQTFRLTQENSINLVAGLNKVAGFEWMDWKFYWNYYF